MYLPTYVRINNRVSIQIIILNIPTYNTAGKILYTFPIEMQ